MELAQIPLMITELQTELTALRQQVARLELQQQQPGRLRRIGMAEAEQQLGVSRFHIRRLVGAGVITSGQRIGSGRNAKWTFDHWEISRLAENPARLNLPNG